MPHAILEYSANLKPEIKQTQLLLALHQIATSSGLFKPTDVKSRAYEADEFLVGEQGAEGRFAHLRVYMMQGRTPEQKRSLSEPLFDAMRNALPKGTSVTVDIRDLDKECYKKIVIAA